jgi:hypothetical protein
MAGGCRNPLVRNPIWKTKEKEWIYYSNSISDRDSTGESKSIREGMKIKAKQNVKWEGEGGRLMADIPGLENNVFILVFFLSVG